MKDIEKVFTAPNRPPQQDPCPGETALVDFPKLFSQTRFELTRQHVPSPPGFGPEREGESKSTDPITIKWVAGNADAYQLEDVTVNLYRAPLPSGGYNAAITFGAAVRSLGWHTHHDWINGYEGGIWLLVELLDAKPGPLDAWKLDPIDVFCEDQGRRVFWSKIMSPDLYDLAIFARISDVRRPDGKPCTAIRCR